MTDQQTAVTHLFSLLTGNQAQVEITSDPESFSVTVTVPDELTGALIGYHGEAIDALQLIVSQMLNQNDPDYHPASLDINGYRAMRSQKLIDLADRAVDQSLQSGREILLPPLPAHERRVIHLHLESSDKASSYSEGEGKNRRIVIRPKSYQAA